jgi:hypothetical protein
LYRFFFEFLLKNERQVAKEVKDEYIDTMSKVYYSYFKTYAYRLAKKQTSETATKDHVLGAAEEVKGKNPLFSLGNRADLLNDLESPALVPHAWVGPPLPYEALFRSLIFTLVDNACREYLFLGDFFMAKSNALMDLFHQVMGKTLGQLLVSTACRVLLTSFYCNFINFICTRLLWKKELPILGMELVFCYVLILF